MPADPAVALDDDQIPGPDVTWVCEVCRAPMPLTEIRTPCPRCGELLPFDEVLAHSRCGYVAPPRQ
jgi:predicted amidophosphoribosyltransferase